MAKTKIASLRGGVGPVGGRGPIGLPGVNSVANDTATAAQVNEPTSETRVALDYAFGDRPGLLDQVQYMYNLPNYRAALEARAAGTKDVKILCVGDSTTLGKGSSNTNIPQRTGYPFRLSHLMERRVAQSAVGLVIPQESTAAQALDTRVTLGTGWDRATGFGFGAVFRAPGNSSFTLTIAETSVQANAWDVYYLVSTATSAQGTIVGQATGGSEVTVPTGGQAAVEIRKFTVTAPTAASSNVLTIRNSDPLGSHQIYIVGVEAYRTTGSKRIRVSNAGISGGTANTWLAGSSAGWTGISAIKAYQPDLTIIDLGINDASTGRSTTDFMTDVNAIVAAAQSVNSDVVIKTMAPSNRTFYPAEQEYVTALRGLLLPTVDLFNHFGDPQKTFDAGYMFDDLHPNDAGYQRIAEYLFSALL